jgi:hypothetical protein
MGEGGQRHARPLYPQETVPVAVVQQNGWVESLAPQRDSILGLSRS